MYIKYINQVKVNIQKDFIFMDISDQIKYVYNYRVILEQLILQEHNNNTINSIKNQFIILYKIILNFVIFMQLRIQNALFMFKKKIKYKIIKIYNFIVIEIFLIIDKNNFYLGFVLLIYLIINIFDNIGGYLVNIYFIQILLPLSICYQNFQCILQNIIVCQRLYYDIFVIIFFVQYYVICLRECFLCFMCCTLNLYTRMNVFHRQKNSVLKISLRILYALQESA
eukprot:TRINITY_DN283_c1_g1_i1.p3 TRINITY_DN283_c1_g1~~TRINITY_DN283_c1_g1_i1.p3  ORF type:complete len:225 (+),score=-9.99 TRINITY_DN283_c1_g1_i1:166-840(+)